MASFGDYPDLQRVWSDSVYRDYHEHLIALMEKFELCYRLYDVVEPKWLATQLLPVSRPDFEAPHDVNTLVIRYEYDFLPRGLLARLVVRLNRYVYDVSKAWRAGVLFKRLGTFALVTETFAGGEIVVKCYGDDPKHLLTVIADEIDSLNRVLAWRSEGSRLLDPRQPCC